MNVNENYFEKIDTYNKAYLLGFLCADGCIYKKTNKITFLISNKDENILEFIKKELEVTNKIVYNTYYDKRTSKYYIRVSLSFSSSKLKLDLSKLGITFEKSTKLSFPKIQEQYYFSFIRGLIDGDGSISKNKTTVSLISTNEVLIEIIDYCKKFNINWANSFQKITEKQSKIYLNKNTLKLFYHLYKDKGFHLERKKKIFYFHKEFENKKSVKYTVRNVVIQKDKLIKKFTSLKEAAKFIGCSSSHLCNITKNRVSNNTGWEIIKKEKVMKEKMKNIRVGLDLDGVICDFGGHFLNYLGIEDKTPAKEWNDDRFMNNFHKIKQDEKFWTSIPPLIDPNEIDFNLVCYCTARSIPQEWTQLWLDAHGFPKVELISVGFDGNKVPHLKEKVDLFIDDAVHNFEELNEAGVNCILMTRSHNVDYNAGDRRICNLNEILEYDYIPK